MEYLIQRGVPQRTAHGVSGRLVRAAMNRGVKLAELSLDEFRAEQPDLDQGVYDANQKLIQGQTTSGAPLSLYIDETDPSKDNLWNNLDRQ